MERPRRISTPLKSSYRDLGNGHSSEDPISSDDHFADPMYEAESDHFSESTDEIVSRKPKARNIINPVSLRKKILYVVRKELKKKRQQSAELTAQRKRTANNKNGDIYYLNREDLKKAVHEVRTRGNKESYLDSWGRPRKMKIMDLCSRDPKLRTRNSASGHLTKTQQILYQLNRSVLKHDWPAVATLIDYMLNLNGKLLPVIWKALFLVLVNHPHSTTAKINSILQMCVGLRSEGEMSSFLQRLFTLPEDLSELEPRDAVKVEEIEIADDWL